MGARGIRRRKPKRPLPSRSDDALGWPTADETPPIMWSEPGSGFEASPFSPAGRMQYLWWFLRRSGRLTDRDIEARAGRAFRSALPVMILFAAFVGAIGLLSLLVAPGVAFSIVALLAVVWFAKRR